MVSLPTDLFGIILSVSGCPSASTMTRVGIYMVDVVHVDI